MSEKKEHSVATDENVTEVCSMLGWIIKDLSNVEHKIPL